MTAAARYRAACAALGLPVWRPGMLAILAPSAPSARIVGHGIDDMDALDRSGAVPDFTDPATIGILLAAVREAWRDPGLCTILQWKSSQAFWWSTTGADGDEYRGIPRRPPLSTERCGTEADALIAALEAAARRGGQP
jgi:hypothetical protein